MSSYWGLLSTPSLGITIRCLCNSANGTLPGFQLPLSGSHNDLAAIHDLAEAFNSLSRDHPTEQEQNRDRARAFNSLSRDHNIA